MGKTSAYGERLSLIVNGISAIAFLTLGGLPGQAATSPDRLNVQQGIWQNSKQLAPEDGSAEDLKPPVSSFLQSDDPPDLPVLEPSILLDQPVSVPPIPLEVPTAPTSDMPFVSVPPIAPPVVASPPAEVVEPIESIDPIEPLETAEITDPADATETAVIPAQNESEVPLEPPFIGDLAERAAPSTTPVAVPELTPDPATLPTLPALTAPLPTEALASSSTPSPLPAVTELAPASIPTVRPANTNRWPDPIPFGQPLP